MGGYDLIWLTNAVLNLKGITPPILGRLAESIQIDHPEIYRTLGRALMKYPPSFDSTAGMN